MGFIVLFGGNSFEHEISIVSAITIKKKIDNIEHFIFLDSDNKFYLVPSESMKSTHFVNLAYKKDKELYLTYNGFVQKSLFGNKIISGTIINLVHGKSGEDGEIASLLGFYGMNFIGPRIEASVISFNKALTKDFAKSRNIKVLPYEVFNKGDKININLPAIIKPARLGSSIGISVIKDKKELDYSLDTAFEFDDVIVVEPFISNIKEYNLAGFYANGEMHFSIIEEVNKGEFLDFDKKYLDFNATSKPKVADLNDNLEKKLKDSFINIYKNCFEGSLIRCDFFIIDDEVYLNEINPIPGSLASYLFDNFNEKINLLSINLPNRETIKINYKYISKIQASKGK
ncbi:D-alanine--D-alanine ligase [Helicobacter sp. MIT 99-5507]|uniref:D-alanine--D-alanine ligase n=1 Tax=Helicobacter sp. MIT 99-5507 TaxID=152489 RepID=UPI000E1EB7FF|nr:D-alanine--D-alanine ligase [Helicobacter sp. MIT 99-5507]RDU58295.1 D-alanine--D-alanine ligase [Helicobacter sp. MIT 99-5507]